MGWWSQSEPLEVAADHRVAFARSVLQLPYLQHANAAIPGRDQPRVLQRSHDHRDRRALHAKHDGEELLLQSVMLA